MSEVLAQLEKKGGISSSIKDAYRNKVLGNTTGLITADLIPYSSRAVVNEGGVVIDTVNNSVTLYADFTLSTTLGSDYWACVSVNMSNFASNYLPQTTDSTRVNQSLFTDESSSKPTNSFFMYTSSSNAICIHKGDPFVNGDHYIVYGSWQY